MFVPDAEWVDYKSATDGACNTFVRISYKSNFYFCKIPLCLKTWKRYRGKNQFKSIEYQ